MRSIKSRCPIGASVGVGGDPAPLAAFGEYTANTIYTGMHFVFADIGDGLRSSAV